MNFGKIGIRNGYVFETSMARPRPKSGQVPPPRGNASSVGHACYFDPFELSKLGLKQATATCMVFYPTARSTREPGLIYAVRDVENLRCVGEG